jgi:hypothetical protein
VVPLGLWNPKGKPHPLHSTTPVNKISSGERKDRRRKEEKINK